MSERPEILTSGSGEPSSTTDGRVDRLDLDEPDGELGEEPARAGFGAAARRVFAGALGAEALGITGLVLAFVPLFGLTIVSRLGAAMVFEEAAGGVQVQDGSGEAELGTTITGLNAALALAGVALGIAALLRGTDVSRGTRGVAGAAVLVGAVAAGISLVIAAAGPGPAYF